MSRYFDFVERMSNNSDRPYLIANLIHGATALTLCAIAVILYLKGWTWYAVIALVVMVTTLVVIRNLDKIKHPPFIRSRQDVNEDETLYLDENGVPFVYDLLPHVKRFWKKAAVFVLLFCFGVAAVVVLIFLNVDVLVWLAVALAAIVFIPWGVYGVLREQYRYRHEPVHCDPNDGLIFDYQADVVFPWFIRGSDPDPYSTDDFVLYTPGKTFWEWLVFRSSQTLQIKAGSGPDAVVILELKDIKNVKHFLAIQKYRESLQAQEVRQGASMIDLLETSITQNDVLSKQANQIIRLLCTLTGANEADYLVTLAEGAAVSDDTKEIK